MEVTVRMEGWREGQRDRGWGWGIGTLREAQAGREPDWWPWPGKAGEGGVLLRREGTRVWGSGGWAHL